MPCSPCKSRLPKRTWQTYCKQTASYLTDHCHYTHTTYSSASEQWEFSDLKEINDDVPQTSVSYCCLYHAAIVRYLKDGIAVAVNAIQLHQQININLLNQMNCPRCLDNLIASDQYLNKTKKYQNCYKFTA